MGQSGWCSMATKLWVPADALVGQGVTLNQVVRKAYQEQEYLIISGDEQGHRIHIDKKTVYLEKPLALKVRQKLKEERHERSSN